jgi:hypothetical protein
MNADERGSGNKGSDELQAKTRSSSLVLPDVHLLFAQHRAIPMGR